MKQLFASAPADDYLRDVGLVVWLVAELEGTLIYDLMSHQANVPPELDLMTVEGMRLTGMTCGDMGKYFVKHSKRITDPRVAEYYRVGGEALVEIGPKRNAMLHSRPGIDGHDPEKKLRLLRLRMKPTTASEAHVISDEWLDEFIGRLDVLRRQVEAAHQRGRHRRRRWSWPTPG